MRPSRGGELHDPDILSFNTVWKSIEIYSERLKPLILYSLVLFLPVQLLTDFIITPLILKTNLRGLVIANNFGKSFIDILIVITYSIIAALITESHISNEAVNNRTLIKRTAKAWPQAMKASLIFWGLTITISIFYYLLIGILNLEWLGFIAVLIGITVWIYFSFSTQAVALRHKSAVEALKYSKTIVTNNWWWTSGNYLLIGLVSLSMAGARIILRRYLGSLTSYFISTGIAQIFAAPFLSIIITIIFLKLEVRYRV